MVVYAAAITDPEIQKARPRDRLKGDLPFPLDPRAQLRFMKSKLVEGAGLQYLRHLMEHALGH